MLQFIPRHLRPRREKIFGPAPSHQLDGNAKARVWAAANAYNAANRRLGQHWGPLTRATMSVLRVLLWRFHGADGSGRCFPAYEKIAAAAKCHRDTVNVALKALEDAGILTWVHRIARIRSPGARPIRSSGERVAGDPHQQRLPVSRPAGA